MVRAAAHREAHAEDCESLPIVVSLRQTLEHLEDLKSDTCLEELRAINLKYVREFDLAGTSTAAMQALATQLVLDGIDPDLVSRFLRLCGKRGLSSSLDATAGLALQDCLLQVASSGGIDNASAAGVEDTRGDGIGACVRLCALFNAQPLPNQDGTIATLHLLPEIVRFCKSEEASVDVRVALLVALLPVTERSDLRALATQLKVAAITEPV